LRGGQNKLLVRAIEISSFLCSIYRTNGVNEQQRRTDN